MALTSAQAPGASGEGRTLNVHALADGAVRHRARTPLGSYNVARGAGVVLTRGQAPRGRARARPRAARRAPRAALPPDTAARAESASHDHFERGTASYTRPSGHVY